MRKYSTICRQWSFYNSLNKTLRLWHCKLNLFDSLPNIQVVSYFNCTKVNCHEGSAMQIRIMFHHSNSGHWALWASCLQTALIIHYNNVVIFCENQLTIISKFSRIWKDATQVIKLLLYFSVCFYMVMGKQVERQRQRD